tara:strand:- start:74 stop:190 length:117 start_codon:yes stop_codon:yes gene_type:complete
MSKGSDFGIGMVWAILTITLAIIPMFATILYGLWQWLT